MASRSTAKVRYDNKRARLRNGETQRPNGTYMYRWTTEEGERRSIYAPTLDELRKQEEQIMVDRHDGIKETAADVTINDLYRLWTEMKRGIKASHNYGRDKKYALTKPQQEIFLQFLLDTPKYNHWYPVFFIMANTGMRVREITGLRWCDVDFEEGMISVNHTLVYYNHMDKRGCYHTINIPKTSAGERMIPMTDAVREAFLMEKQYQREAELESIDTIDGYEDFIFFTQAGHVQRQDNLNTAIKRAIRDCNEAIIEKQGFDAEPVLLPNFSCHNLRHTFAKAA